MIIDAAFFSSAIHSIQLIFSTEIPSFISFHRRPTGSCDPQMIPLSGIPLEALDLARLSYLLILLSFLRASLSLLRICHKEHCAELGF